jgi:aminoglycoside phosphotransferase (APT) family kinase protein
MRDWREWLRAIGRMLDAGVESWAEEGVEVRRVIGGNNNALYRIEAEGQTFACKLCVADFRLRAAHEYAALRVFQNDRVDLAPEPVGLDESCEVVPYPAVAYRWLPGQALGPALSEAQLAALLASIQLMHTLEPDQHPGLDDSWFHWFDFSRYLDELAGFYAYSTWLETTQPAGRDLRARLDQLVSRCARAVTATPAKPDRESVARRICRADTNLANAIWNDDGRVRWVDWEYSGWGDPALELAELRWHAAMTPAQHDWLRAHYRRPRGDAGFDERLAVWDRIITTRWAFLILRALWSAHNGPDRVRLSRLPMPADQLRARLVQFIERAEHSVE